MKTDYGYLPAACSMLTPFHSILAFLLKISLMFTPLLILLFNRSLFNIVRGILLLDVKPEYLRIFYKHIH